MFPREIFKRMDRDCAYASLVAFSSDRQLLLRPFTLMFWLYDIRPKPELVGDEDGRYVGLFVGTTTGTLVGGTVGVLIGEFVGMTVVCN